MTVFLQSHGLQGSALSDHILTQRARDRCSELGANRSVVDVMGRAAANQQCGYSLTAMGGAIHGAHNPTKRELLAHFDTWSTAITFMLAKSDS